MKSDAHVGDYVHDINTDALKNKRFNNVIIDNLANIFSEFELHTSSKILDLGYSNYIFMNSASQNYFKTFIYEVVAS